MKNKEIEELLNELKEYASGGMSGLYPSEDTVKNFVSYIEQLEKENGLQKERIAYLERSNNRREDTIISLQDELIDIETNRDKAIEVINTQLKNAEGGLKDNLRIIKFNLIKGSCTFEDLKTEEDYKYVLKGDSE